MAEFGYLSEKFQQVSQTSFYTIYVQSGLIEFIMKCLTLHPLLIILFISRTLKPSPGKIPAFAID